MIHHNGKWAIKSSWSKRKSQWHNWAVKWNMDGWGLLLFFVRYQWLCTNWHCRSPWKECTQCFMYLCYLSMNQTWSGNNHRKNPKLLNSRARNNGSSKTSSISRDNTTTLNKLSAVHDLAPSSNHGTWGKTCKIVLNWKLVFVLDFSIIPHSPRGQGEISERVLIINISFLNDSC